MAFQLRLASNTQTRVFCPLANIFSIKFPVAVGRSTSLGFAARPATTRLRCLPSDKLEPEVLRPLANFTSDIWGDYFTSMPLDETKFKSDTDQTEMLKEEVNKMLMTPTNADPVEKIKLIDTLCLLGVSYHFETEIEQQLNQIFDSQLPQLLEKNDEFDLCTVALVFRVFRQYGYRISCDVFNKFMDSDNKLKKSLDSDLKGMLSLYEAAHLSIPGEEVLDQTLAFTKTHLKSLPTKGSSNNLFRHINNALKQPLHRGIPRLEARKYIDLYESNECRNETLHKFAKHDYRRVQFLHLQELRDLSEWWKESRLAEEYSYARNRVVEGCFWAVAMRCEPLYADARIRSLKCFMLATIVDDTYDGYGTFDELQCFTDAIQRWDYGALEQLPGYMRKLYRTILDVFCENEKSVAAEGRSYSIDCAREEWKRIVRAYQNSSDWTKQGYVPPMEEYLQNEVITGAAYFTTAQLFLGMGELAGIRVCEWLANDPKICRASSTISRIENDIAGHEAEQRRGRHPPSSVQCYMKQYGVSKEKAIEELQKMVENGWKEMNEQCMRPTDVPRDILLLPFNGARLSETLFMYGDGNVEPEYLKDFIRKILVDDITI